MGDQGGAEGSRALRSFQQDKDFQYMMESVTYRLENQSNIPGDLKMYMAETHETNWLNSVPVSLKWIFLKWCC